MSALTAIDLFSGAGGTTQGLRDAGFKVLAAVENDTDAAATYAANHAETNLIERSIQQVQAPALARRLESESVHLDLLTACPPCQPFSTLGNGDISDPRNGLINSVFRFVKRLRPRAILLENVPGLRREPRFRRLVRQLEADYVVGEYLLDAQDFGVPQHRKRVIVLAIEKSRGVTLPESLRDALPPSFCQSRRTAGTVFVVASKISAKTDPVHRARIPTPKTIARLRATSPGGGRRELPESLQLACHSGLKTASATSIYGRIDPGKPAPTMTTRCTTPSCGRFGHPTEDRGLTLREAALIQTFPTDYQFEGSYGAIERQIGNAVPPHLAYVLGRVVAGLLSDDSSDIDRNIE